MKKTILTISGPGHHSKKLIHAIEKVSGQFNYVNYWPDFYGVFQGEKKTYKSYNFLYKLIFFLRRFFTFFGNPHLHSDLVYTLYAAYSTKFVKSIQADIIWGFQMVSYKAIRNKKKSTFILEYAMNHICTYENYMAEEYRLVGYEGVKNSYFSDSVKKNMIFELQNADVINVLSSFSKQTLVQNNIPESKIRVTPLGIDTTFFSPNSEKKHSSKLKVLFVGRIEYLKGVHYLLEALKFIPESEIELTLVGGFTEESSHLLKKFQTTNNVSLHPQSSPDKLKKLYNEHDILVLPSIQESFGIVILEAMAMGLPVIATQNTGGPDIISDNEDGFIIPIRNSTAIANALIFLLKNKDLLAKMSVKAREKVCSGYNLENYNKNVLTLLKSVR